MRPSPAWLAVGLAAALVLSAPSPAHATFPIFLSPRTVTPRATEAVLGGAYGNLAPDAWTALAAVRHGLLRGIDVGARAGALWVETAEGRETAPVGGLGAKVQVLRESIDIPVDFAVDIQWTVARPDGDTWSDLGFTALFGKRIYADWLEELVPNPVTAVVGGELAFLAGTARPGRDESAAYGIVGLEVVLSSRVTVAPEAKLGSDTVLGLSVRYRF